MILACPVLFFVTAENIAVVCTFIEAAEELINWWNRIIIAPILITCKIITVSYLAIVIMLQGRLLRHFRASLTKLPTFKARNSQGNILKKGGGTKPNKNI